MKDKSKIIAIALLVVAIIIVVVSYLLNNNNGKESNIDIVTNYSDFYTVDSCMYRFITYVASEDSESLYLILDSNYKKKNKINQNNVMELFNNINENSSFNSKKMYYEKLNDNITKYYVYGSIETAELIEDDTTDNLNSTDAYFIVYLDSSNQTFSIEPYSGDIFIGGEQNE